MINKYNKKLTIDDINKFYILQSHISKLSSNIGVICESDKKFIKFKKLIIKQNKDNNTIIIENKNSIRIIKDNNEKNYIRIYTIEDLYNKYFKKYITIINNSIIRSL